MWTTDDWRGHGPSGWKLCRAQGPAHLSPAESGVGAGRCAGRHTYFYLRGHSYITRTSEFEEALDLSMAGSALGRLLSVLVPQFPH